MIERREYIEKYRGYVDLVSQVLYGFYGNIYSDIQFFFLFLKTSFSHITVYQPFPNISIFQFIELKTLALLNFKVQANINRSQNHCYLDFQNYIFRNISLNF